MFFIFLLLLLVVDHTIAYIDTIARRNTVLSLGHSEISRRDLLNDRLLRRMIARKPQKQAAKSKSRTSSPPRSSSASQSSANLLPILSISRDPRIDVRVPNHTTGKPKSPVHTEPDMSIWGPYIVTKGGHSYFDPLAPTRRDPLYPKARRAQKNLGLDKLQSPHHLEWSASDIMEHEKWQQDIQSRVVKAKSRAILGQKYQPMGINKAKAYAKEARTKADQEYRDLLAWKPLEHKSSNIDRVGRAERLAYADQDASYDYRMLHEKAALKAKQENRWNDVARHEQSAAREKTRNSLRQARMKVLTNKNWVALDRLYESKYNQVRPTSAYREEKERKGLFDAELKIASAQYQQAREMFSGSDSEEELPKSRWTSKLKIFSH